MVGDIKMRVCRGEKRKRKFKFKFKKMLECQEREGREARIGRERLTLDKTNTSTAGQNVKFQKKKKVHT